MMDVDIETVKKGLYEQVSISEQLVRSIQDGWLVISRLYQARIQQGIEKSNGLQ